MGQLSRPICEIGILSGARAPYPYGFDTALRAHGTQQHATRRAFRFGDDVQAIVQSIVQINICVARWSENNGGSRCDAPRGMAGEVLMTQIRFRFDDDSRRFTMHENLPEQRARHFGRRSGIELSWENAIHLDIMRLFTALSLPLEIVERLDGFITEWKLIARLRWSLVENLHVTTKFIGDWPGERLDELRERLPRDRPAPRVDVRGIGFFPNDRFPKVLFARVEPDVRLEHLARATDQAMNELGVPAEKHPYHPHVTLARIPSSVRLHGLRERIANLGLGEIGSYTPSEYSLFESRAGQYLNIGTFPLQAAR